MGRSRGMFEGRKLRGLMGLVLVIWTAYLAGLLFSADLLVYGIRPREATGLIGVLAWPFLHADLTHLANNSISLVLFGAIISLRSSSQAFLGLSFLITLYAGLGVWLLGRPYLHVGASGLVFGYFGYILTRGVYDGRISSVLISTGVMLLFGGMMWGVLPTDAQVSWEGHLFGFLSGVVLAVRYRSR